MEVIVGTYNHVLFGFKFVLNEESDHWNFEPLFTDQGHAGCIKTVATGGRYLASGGSDETIRLFDMKKHIELGTLMQQSGSVTSINFFGSQHMLSASEDGTICIWKCKSWECEKVLKGHRGPVLSISIHPTGRLALSVSKDKSIKTWNLLTGRPAYTTSIKEVGEIIRWSPSGDSYAVVVGCKLTVNKITGIDEPHIYTCEKYILAIEYLTDSIIMLAGEFNDIIIYNFQKSSVLQKLCGHKVRVKGVAIGDQDDKKVFIFTVSSDGNIKAWCLNKENYEDHSLLANIDLPGRPTCITVKQSVSLKLQNKVTNEITNESNETYKKQKLKLDQKNDITENNVEVKHSKKKTKKETGNNKKETDIPKKRLKNKT
ncbi:p21-activated protein kinase-interacting protein 1-like isoform X2 [Hydra vulgaris]|uniref:P21-activated protein kinase-interacting protein 1-like isoform X2 n=1 Tax=Hydra vulgaris TaxID=6087 RepID=A0ABM4D7G7_HYDVU